MGASVNAAVVSADTGPLLDAIEKGIKAMRALEDQIKDTGKTVEHHNDILEKMKEKVAELAIEYVSFKFAKEMLSEVIAETMKLEETQNRLAVVYQATGGVVGQSLDELREKAEEFQKTTLFDADQTRSAEAAMLSFTSVRGETFDKAMKSAANMASMTGGDLASSARLIGLVLDAPARGMERLRRSYVSLTSVEQDHIRALVEANKLHEAQEVVLAALDRTQRGAAEHMDTGLTKSTKDLTKAWSDLLQTMGKSPNFQRAAEGVSKAGQFILHQLQNIQLPHPIGMMAGAIPDKPVSAGEHFAGAMAKETVDPNAGKEEDTPEFKAKMEQQFQQWYQAKKAAEDAIARLTMDSQHYLSFQIQQTIEKMNMPQYGHGTREQAEAMQAEATAAQRRQKVVENSVANEKALRDEYYAYVDKTKALTTDTDALEKWTDQQKMSRAEQERNNTFPKVTQGMVDTARATAQATQVASDYQGILRDTTQGLEDELAKLSMTPAAYAQYEAAMKSARAEEERHAGTRRKYTADDLEGANARLNAAKARLDNQSSMRDQLRGLEDEQKQLTLSADAYTQYKIAVDAARRAEDLNKATLKDVTAEQIVAIQKQLEIAQLIQQSASNLFSDALMGRITSFRDLMLHVLNDVEQALANFLSKRATQAFTEWAVNTFLGGMLGSMGGGGGGGAGGYTDGVSNLGGGTLLGNLTPGGGSPISLSGKIAPGSAATAATNVHLSMPITVSALDGASAYAVLQQNAGVIQGIVVDGVRRSRAMAGALRSPGG